MAGTSANSVAQQHFAVAMIQVSTMEAWGLPHRTFALGWRKPLCFSTVSALSLKALELVAEPLRVAHYQDFL